MIKAALLVLCSLICLSYCSNYEGYQVLRLSLDNIRISPEKIEDLAEKTNSDIWAVNEEERWVDVMVAPEQLHFWKRIPHTVQFEDVSVLVSENERENKRVITEKMESESTAAKFNFDYFPPFADVKAWVTEQAEKHSSLAKIISIGKTYESKDIFGIEITSNSSAPIFYAHCTMHAREWISTTTCLTFIDQLLNSDANRNKLVGSYRWIIVPVLNIDGYEHTHTKARLWRKNRQPNEKSSCDGTDLNRNYAYSWGRSGASSNPCSETFRGEKAFSAPETQSEINFLQPHLDAKNVAAYLDIHSYGGLFISPWGYTTTPPKDYPAMVTQMKSSVNAIASVNGNKYSWGNDAIYQTSGDTLDHMYGAGGVIHSYCIECYGNSFTPPISYIVPVGREVWAGIRQIAIDNAKIAIEDQ